MRKLIEKIYKFIIRPYYFRRDPDDVHENILVQGKRFSKSNFFKWLLKTFLSFQHKSLEQEILGIHFKNPIGLSAGFDKDGDLVEVLQPVGFGFMQVGSITHKEYHGNPKPWTYRLPEAKSLIINYGLKNIGAKNILEKVGRASIPEDFPISFSVAKTNSRETATLEAGTEDYTAGLQETADSQLGDFITINISCPNAFGGEPFTDPESLEYLLREVGKLEIKKPIFIKMPINLSWDEFQKLLDVALKFEIDGVIIGNANKNRTDKIVKDCASENIKGSLTGKPTEELSNELISQTYKYCGGPDTSHRCGQLIIIGVGGVFSAEDAYEKIKRGASLVQLITGVIYEGPQLIGQISKGLVKLLKEGGYKNISEAVGVYYKK